MRDRRTLVVDFDGTIVDHEFPGIGKLKAGAKEALIALSKTFRIVIYSCRNNAMEMHGTDMYFKAMKHFMEVNGLDFCEFDAGTSGKPVAHAYIDDRGIAFEDNWPAIQKRLLRGM